MKIRAGQPRESPRVGQYADEPGHFEPALVLKHSQIDPGEAIEGDLFITGYGNIEGSKLVFYPSPGEFDFEASFFESGIHETSNDVVIFGGSRAPIGESGVTVHFGGMTAGWENPTIYFDVSQGTVPQLSTETKLVRPPVYFRLQTKKRIRPGDYQILFYLTYFNGAEWKTSMQSASFRVRNVLQRHEVAIAVVATIGAAVSIVPPAVDAIKALFN